MVRSQIQSYPLQKTFNLNLSSQCRNTSEYVFLLVESVSIVETLFLVWTWKKLSNVLVLMSEEFSFMKEMPETPILVVPSCHIIVLTTRVMS